MKFDLPTVQGLIGHYAKLQGLRDWKITSEIVPGLLHHGEDAWAIVESDPAARVAHVRVRDLATTPIAAADPWHELKVTISHELWHPWVTWLLAEPSVDREEALVEAAAQAVVRAAGDDARVMARSIQAIPAAVRARVATRPKAKISARASTRARGGNMDESQVQGALDAIEANDAEKAKGILKQILAALAVKGAGGAMPAAEPDGDEGAGALPAREDGGMQDPTKKKDDPLGAAPAMMARARAAAKELEDIAADARKGAKDLLVTSLRARLGDDHKGLPAIEKRILAAADYTTAKLVHDIAIDSAPEAATRARSGDRQTAAPNLDAKPPIVEPEELKAMPAGLRSMWRSVAEAEGVESANKSVLAPARARLARDAEQGRN